MPVHCFHSATVPHRSLAFWVMRVRFTSPAPTQYLQLSTRRTKLSATWAVQHYPGMTEGLRFPDLCVPAVSRQPALILRPWRASDIPALAAEMSRDHLLGGMWSRPDERPFRTVLRSEAQRSATMDERDAARWLESQDRGWRDGDRLCFAVLEVDDVGGCVLAGNVGLKNREETGRIGERETAEIGYWTAVAARGRGIAPAAVRAVTDWAFDAFSGASLRQIMLVHDVDNPPSCRVADKAGYPFRELSPANPPHWFTDGHIHMRLAPAEHDCAGMKQRVQQERLAT